MSFRLRIPDAFRAAFTLAGAAAILFAGAACALNAQPRQADAPPSPAAVFQNPIPPDQLTFLLDYAGQPAQNLLKDKRYRKLVKEVIPSSSYHYGRDMWLTGAMDMVMDRSKAPVAILDGRYAIVSGYNGPYLHGQGFLWFDMQAGTVLGVFYFRPTNGEPTPTLTVFSKQLTDTDLAMSQLPPAFTGDLGQWALAARIPAITPRYFIPANGKKYVLVHDQEYCAAPPGVAIPPANICEQLADQAADADMNAAYFMKETHNAADATAWMLGADQRAWMGLRDRRCGTGIACRVQFTRERTRALMGPRPRLSGRR